ncbi:DUF1345 domain-containing protein [Actinomadura macrotermitis]|uniref:DUF1345 domain-containing protein n=1 Tax=Actinomadura macrotermitis TaxID=2585200 RepID=A0A7K0BPT3_9ACTN|nr:DUF1345 domain-containing protein [Actinomadura macrotermitis]MQY03175.1 hypothetical protein [Actinomadura macrotermitis]
MFGDRTPRARAAGDAAMMLPSVRARRAVAVLLGVVVFLVVGLTVDPALGLLSGIAAQAGVFALGGVLLFWPMTAERTRAHARRDDFKPLLEETIVVLEALVSLAAIITVLLIHDQHDRKPAVVAGLLAIFMSWAMLHLMYAVRYAYLYYRHPVGGIDFNSDDPPSYRDFFYFSYNLGMAYQVSDTNVSSTEIRAVVLRHTLLSYAFGTVILAMTVNIVAGIATN